MSNGSRVLLRGFRTRGFRTWVSVNGEAFNGTIWNTTMDWHNSVSSSTPHMETPENENSEAILTFS